MSPLLRAGVLGLALVASTTAYAQTTQTVPPPSSSTDTRETRPATVTTLGDTGIWFVPTGEVLPHKKWSLSFHRTNLDDGQGFADVSSFPFTFGIGVGNRAEIFGAMTVITRIDRDTRPLFFASPNQNGTGGGILVNHPLHRSEWTGNQVGDLRVGAKINLVSEGDQKPVAFGVRLHAKLPTGKDDGPDAVSSGKMDFGLDGVISKFSPVAEVAGYAGFISRGSPDGFTLTNGLRWGFGAAFPQRYNLGLRATAEIYGERYFDETITAPAGTGTDGSAVPASTILKGPIVVAVGLNWQAPNGFFVGGAASWNIKMASRSEVAGFNDEPKDDKGLQVRIGFHPGARRYVPPPPPPAPAPPPAAAPPPVARPNRPPTVVAQCDPCTVEIGKTATVSADAQDPDGDPLTYRWTAPAGSLSAPSSRQSPWTAPMVEGPVRMTVTVDDGKGGTASANVTINVTKPVVREFNFEDVHFDFDRHTLRPEALRVLDEAVTAMQANPTLRLTLEGHTCNIGTNEYNLALSDRRAQAVKDYLVARGISADRLVTVGLGEERPKYDNSREETRRLNRRAALVVRLQ